MSDNETRNLNINWFPGHMAKAHRMIREHLKLVDVVIELLDARIPVSSSNPVIQDLVESKPRVIALNKADLAETQWTEQWIAQFRSKGLDVVALDAIGGKGAKNLIHKVEQIASEKQQKLAAKGIKSRPVRAMILGIPNVGKSSLINQLKGTSVVKTADKPGVTRGKQWIKVGKNLDLLDTPGVLWPKLDDPSVAFRLAVTGAINDEVYDFEEVMEGLLELLLKQYPERLAARYNLTQPLPSEVKSLLELIAVRRGCLRAGGVADFDKTRKIILNEFRGGKLGPFTLDHVKENDGHEDLDL